MGHRQKKTQPTTQPFPTLSKTKKTIKKKKTHLDFALTLIT